MERVNESPMAVSVTTRDQLQSWGVRNPFEMIGRLPGFSFYNSDEYGQNGVLTRGLYGVFRVGYSYELMPEIDWDRPCYPPTSLRTLRPRAVRRA